MRLCTNDEAEASKHGSTAAPDHEVGFAVVKT